MAIITGTITMRRGKESDFVESKMVYGEIAIITDTPAIWFCYTNGKCKKIALSEDIRTDDEIANIIKQYIADNLTDELEDIKKDIKTNQNKIKSNTEDIQTLQELGLSVSDGCLNITYEED